MNAIKEAKKLIAKDPFKPSAKTLADLVLSLESHEPFQLERLYALQLSDFDLAVQIIKEWRLDRYYAGKAKLYDFAVQASALNQPEQLAAAVQQQGGAPHPQQAGSIVADAPTNSPS